MIKDPLSIQEQGKKILLTNSLYQLKTQMKSNNKEPWKSTKYGRKTLLSFTTLFIHMHLPGHRLQQNGCPTEMCHMDQTTLFKSCLLERILQMTSRTTYRSYRLRFRLSHPRTPVISKKMSLMTIQTEQEAQVLPHKNKRGFRQTSRSTTREK